MVITYDEDGTYTQNVSSNQLNNQFKTVAPNLSYLSDPACYKPNSTNLIHTWSSNIICDSLIKIRKMLYRHYS